MKNHLLILAFLLTGSLLVTGCGSDDHNHDQLSPEEMEQHVLEAHTDEEGNIVYTCSMHPEIRESEPGDCPVCGMDLTPVSLVEADDEQSTAAQDSAEVQQDEPTPQSTQEVEADEESEAQGRLPITPRQQQLIGMQYDTVENRSISHSFRTVGFLTHAEPNLTDIVPRVGGYIEEVHVAETGVHVMEGEPLVTIYSPGLISSQEDYLIALRRGDDSIARRARERLRLLHMPESEIKRLEEKGEPLLEVTLTSPVKGHIMNLNVREGMEFKPETLLYRLNDHSLLWMLADVYEDDLPFVSIGQRVTVEIQGRQENNHEGEVSFIPPMANKETRTIPVRIEIPNPDFELKMEQYGWATFHRELDERLSVHRDAVLKTGRRDVVFKKSGRGRFEPVEVHLGPIADEYYEVLHGLEEGDQVVTNGRFWLDAESRLRGVGAEAMPEHQH